MVVSFVYWCFLFFFFFKQKTAYEMRISDWSSDVCSSDLAEALRITFDPEVISYGDLLDVLFATHDPTTLNRQGNDVGTQYRSAIFPHSPEQERSEEHTSELQSLMRISYAVFCLKKKTNTKT